MTVVSSTSITAATAAHAAGAASVVVTNTDAQSGTLTNGYTYTSSTGGGPISFVQVKSTPSVSSSSSVAVTSRCTPSVACLPFAIASAIMSSRWSRAGISEGLGKDNVPLTTEFQIPITSGPIYRV